MKIQFADNEHRAFYERIIQQCRNTDSYHRALVYTLGLSPDTRSHFKDCFSIPGDCIDPDALSKGWQTSGSMALTRLAFNLWNGFDDNSCFAPLRYRQWSMSAAERKYRSASGVVSNTERSGLYGN